MKNFLPPLLFCSVLLCFVSCQDESEPAVPEVTEVPDIPFEALAPDDTLSLTETLRLQKPESIESAKIYLDNNLLSSLENAPFEYELNTRAHAEEFELYDTYVFTYSEYPGLSDFIKKGILPDGIVYLSPGEYQYATIRYEADDEGGRKKGRKKAGLLRSAFAF